MATPDNARARLAALSRWHPEELETIESARAEYREANYLAEIKEIVRTAPPLTSAARDRIRDLMWPVITGD